MFDDAFALKADLPLAGLEQTDGTLESGAFPGAVRADVPEDLAWLEGETYILDHRDAIEPLRQPANFKHPISWPINNLQFVDTRHMDTVYRQVVPGCRVRNRFGDATNARAYPGGQTLG